MVDVNGAAAVVKTLDVQIEQGNATLGGVLNELAQVKTDRVELESRVVEIRSRENALSKEAARLTALIEKATNARRDAKILAGVR